MKKNIVLAMTTAAVIAALTGCGSSKSTETTAAATTAAEMAVNALHSGAADFLQKPVKSEKLLASVEKAATASVTLAEPLRVMSQEEAKQKLSLITEREIQILKLTSLRLSSRAVGERLGISDRTVESHRASAGKKLQLHTKEEILQLIDLANGTVG